MLGLEVFKFQRDFIKMLWMLKNLFERFEGVQISKAFDLIVLNVEMLI